MSPGLHGDDPDALGLEAAGLGGRDLAETVGRGAELAVHAVEALRGGGEQEAIDMVVREAHGDEAESRRLLVDGALRDAGRALPCR